MDPMLTAVLTSFATTMAMKGANGPAKTLNLLWEATFGHWDKSLQDYVNKRDNNLANYAKDITTASEKIPSNYIKEEPDISIIGPALEASKYYIDDKTIRKMFANLIAASFDKRADDKIHHSYVEIIKQMSPNDAKLLSIIKFNGPLATVCIKLKDAARQLLLNGSRDILLLTPSITENNRQNTLSITNLDRLGLVEIDHVKSLSDPSYYDRYRNLDIYHEAEKIVKSKPSEFTEVILDTGLFTITPLGEAFKELCLQ